MIYKTESIDRVIASVIRNLGLGQDEIPYDDIVEWMADALEHIGTYYQQEEKQSFIIIEDYEGMLPCDFFEFVAIANGCAITPGPDGFWGSTLTGVLTEAGVDWDLVPALDRFKLTSGGMNNWSTDYNQLVTHLHMNKGLIGTIQDNMITENDYNINLNKITTSFRNGIIKLQYLAIPIDDRGWPLVPAHVSFRDALYWKVVYHMSMRNPSVLPNPKMRDVDWCYDKWTWYCGQARAEANMPDIEGMIRMKNIFMRLVKDPNLDMTNFKTLGTQEIR